MSWWEWAEWISKGKKNTTTYDSENNRRENLLGKSSFSTHYEEHSTGECSEIWQNTQLHFKQLASLAKSQLQGTGLVSLLWHYHESKGKSWNIERNAFSNKEKIKKKKVYRHSVNLFRKEGFEGQFQKIHEY